MIIHEESYGETRSITVLRLSSTARAGVKKRFRSRRDALLLAACNRMDWVNADLNDSTSIDTSFSRMLDQFSNSTTMKHLAYDLKDPICCQARIHPCWVRLPAC